jgi:hypothetical protein
VTTVQKLRDIAEMICGSDMEWVAVKQQIIAALVLVQDDEPRAIGLIRKVLTTGSAQAREESREELRNMLGEVTDSYVKNGKDWKNDCGHITGPRMIEELMHTWSVYQIQAEYPTGDSSYALARKTSWALHSIGAAQLGLTEYPVNYESWRGIAALAISGASNEIKDKRALTLFARYAGNHPDLKAVLDIARERNTIDVEMIEQVIKQSGTNDPLRRGTL